MLCYANMSARASCSAGERGAGMSHAVILTIPDTIAIFGPVGLLLGLGLVMDAYLSQQADDDAKKRAILASELARTAEQLTQDIQQYGDDVSSTCARDFSRLQLLHTELTHAADAQHLDRLLVEYSEVIFALRSRIEMIKLEDAEISPAADALIKSVQQVLGHHDTPAEELAAELNAVIRIRSAKVRLAAARNLAKRVRSMAQSERDAARDLFEELPEQRYIHLTHDQRAKALLRDEIVHYHDRMKALDADAYGAVQNMVEESREEPILQRLEMMRNTIKLHYGSLKEQIAQSRFFRENLEKALRELRTYPESDQITADIAEILQKNVISREAYGRISESIGAFLGLQIHRRYAASIRERLALLGYDVIGETDRDGVVGRLVGGEIVMLDTQWHDYKVMLRMSGEGEIATRFVRVVASEEEKARVSTYDRQRDAEVAKKWCADFDRFVEGLRVDGLPLHIVVRKEPEEEDCLCMVDKNLAAVRREHHKQQGGNERQQSF